MKCKIIETPEKSKFVPFKLEISVETEDELAELYHRFGLSVDTVKNATNKNRVKFPDNIHYSYESDLWGKLWNRAKAYGLLKKVDHHY